MDLAGLFITDESVARLTGSRCESCRAIAFPPRHVCGQCGSRDQSATTLAGNGVVVSTTHVVTPPAGFDQPIDVALIDLAMPGTDGNTHWVLSASPSSRQAFSCFSSRGTRRTDSTAVNS